MTGPRIYPDNTAVSQTPRPTPGLLDLLKQILVDNPRQNVMELYNDAKDIYRGGVAGAADAARQYLAETIANPRAKNEQILGMAMGAISEPAIIGKAAKAAAIPGIGKLPNKAPYIPVYTAHEIGLPRRRSTVEQEVRDLLLNPKRSENLDAFLGKSKVTTDRSGNPIQLYHGTDREITQFDPGGELSFATNDPDIGREYAEAAMEREMPGATGGRLYPLYGRMERPLDLTRFGSLPNNKTVIRHLIGKGFDKSPMFRGAEPVPAYWGQGEFDDPLRGDVAMWRLLQQLGIGRKMLPELGYDGVKFIDRSPSGAPHIAWGFVDPTQLKSSVGNSGAYSRNSPNIALGLAGLFGVGAAARQGDRDPR